MIKEYKRIIIIARYIKQLFLIPTIYISLSFLRNSTIGLNDEIHFGFIFLFWEFRIELIIRKSRR
jgi:hypothetical protein